MQASWPRYFDATTFKVHPAVARRRAGATGSIRREVMVRSVCAELHCGIATVRRLLRLTCEAPAQVYPTFRRLCGRRHRLSGGQAAAARSLRPRPKADVFRWSYGSHGFSGPDPGRRDYSLMVLPRHPSLRAVLSIQGPPLALSGVKYRAWRSREGGTPPRLLLDATRAPVGAEPAVQST